MAHQQQPRKRSRLETLEENMTIVIAAPEQGECVRLPVHEATIRGSSSVAEGLPSAGDSELVWDLSGFLVDGKRVDRETVVAWLNRVYHVIMGRTYEEPGQRERQREGTFAGLQPLVSFADAVGTRPGIINACLRGTSWDLENLVLVVEDNPNKPIYLYAGGPGYRFGFEDENSYESRHSKPAGVSNSNCLVTTTPRGSSYLGCFESVQKKQEFLQQAMQQTESLLYLSERLQLQPLMDCLHTFIAASALGPDGIFFGRLADIISERVLSVAVPPNATSETQQAWITSILTLPCGVTRGPNIYKLFDVHPQYNYSPGYDDSDVFVPQHFTATLRLHFMNARPGDVVDCQLDLGKASTLRIGDVTWPVQLLLGHAITNEDDFEEMMRGNKRRDEQAAARAAAAAAAEEEQQPAAP